MKYNAIFHANLNYAYLLPERYEFVIRESYELIFDTMREEFGDQKYVFEASGYTIDQMADKAPDVLAKLRAGIESGQIEFMGSPYGHLMMSNFPVDDSVWALEFAQEAYEVHLGIRAESGWNPECGWRQYVPDAFKRAGFKQMTLDFDGFALSTRPEVREVEMNPDKKGIYGTDLPWYDLPGSEKTLHFPFKDVVPGLNGFVRSDRLCLPALQYMLGHVDFETYFERIVKYSQQNPGEPEGALIVFADDAEYIGTNGWYEMKYNKRSWEHLFQRVPESRDKLIRFVSSVVALPGEFVTFDYICNKLPPLDQKFYVEDDLAWHRTWSTAWASTPDSLKFDPMCDEIRAKLREVEARAKIQEDRAKVRQAWFHLTCAENSDGRWPPPPAKVCPFNRQYVQDHIDKARRILADWD